MKLHGTRNSTTTFTLTDGQGTTLATATKNIQVEGNVDILAVLRAGVDLGKVLEQLLAGAIHTCAHAATGDVPTATETSDAATAAEVVPASADDASASPTGEAASGELPEPPAVIVLTDEQLGGASTVPVVHPSVATVEEALANIDPFDLAYFLASMDGVELNISPVPDSELADLDQTG